MAFHNFVPHFLILPTDYVTDPNSAKHVPVEKLSSPASSTHSMVLSDYPITRFPFRSMVERVKLSDSAKTTPVVCVHLLHSIKTVTHIRTLQGNPVNSSDTVYFTGSFDTFRVQRPCSFNFFSR